MSLRCQALLGIAILLVGTVSESDAGARRRACRLWNCGVGPYVCVDNVTCQPCVQYQNVECEVLVPQTVYEARKVMVTEYQQQVQDRTVTVYRQVPREVVREVKNTVYDPVVKQREVPHVTCRPVVEEKEVSYTYCEPVYEQKQGVRTVMDPVWEDVTREYTVQVPRQEWKTTTRMVCRMEPVTTSRTVTVDRGCWETRVVGTVPVCGPCDTVACRPIVNKVWCPNLVQVEVPCTTYRPVQVPVEVRYCTTVWEPQVRKCVQRVCRYQPREEVYNYTTCRMVSKTGVRKVQVCRYVQETSVRVVDYTEWVPRTEVREVKSTVYDCVPEEKVVQVNVCVPVQVEKEIQVAVCKMVPQTVTRRVAIPCEDCVH